MEVFCPTCKALLGHFRDKADADAHYPSGCAFCKNAQSPEEKAKSDSLKAKGSRFVDAEEMEE